MDVKIGPRSPLWVRTSWGSSRSSLFYFSSADVLKDEFRLGHIQHPPSRALISIFATTSTFKIPDTNTTLWPQRQRPQKASRTALREYNIQSLNRDPFIDVRNSKDTAGQLASAPDSALGGLGGRGKTTEDKGTVSSRTSLLTCCRSIANMSIANFFSLDPNSRGRETEQSEDPHQIGLGRRDPPVGSYQGRHHHWAVVIA